MRRATGDDHGAVITGVGGYVPPDTLDNAALAAVLDTDDDWIVSRTGIRSRHVVAPAVRTGALAVEAGRRALAAAGRTSVAAVVVATSTPDRSCPATAPWVADRLGLTGIAAFDVAAVCSGFVYALAVADGLVAAGTADSVLVVGADTFSRILDPADRSTRVIFGDGAGAVVVEAGSGTGRVLATSLGSDGSGADLITVPGDTLAPPDPYFRMSGSKVFVRAVEHMTTAVREVLDRVGWHPDEVDALVPHQANARILTACAAELGIPETRVVSNVAAVGNTVAASIPLALADAVRSGRLTGGERVVLTAFGGGLSWGAIALIWPEKARSAPNDGEEDPR